MQARLDPNEWFEAGWYLNAYPDIARAGIEPLGHYLDFGIAELRDPGPRFDATFYTETYPQAAENPLLFHCRIGRRRGYATEWRVSAEDYRPSKRKPLTAPREAIADVIILADGTPDQLQNSVTAVLAGRSPRLGQVVVIDGPRTDATLHDWLEARHAEGQISLLSPRRAAGEIEVINNALAAGNHDIVLLSAAVEVPAGWLDRLAAQAHAAPNIATVSPFSNVAGWTGFPSRLGGKLPFGLSAQAIDQACQSINVARAASVPVTSRRCMLIRRAALLQFGIPGGAGFDTANWDIEFCLRASRHGWRNLVACDTFVLDHAPPDSPREAGDPARLKERYPDYPARLASHQRKDRAAPFRFAVIAPLLSALDRPVIAMVTHFMGGGVRRHIQSIAHRIRDDAATLLLEGWVTEHAGRRASDMRFSLPDMPGGQIVTVEADQVGDAVAMLRLASVSRVHVHHLLWFDFDVRAMIRRLGVKFDVTVHDNHAICPQLNMLPQATSFYCGGPDIATCNACIAISPSANQARDILSWRLRYAWQFQDAERVLCPSEDMKQRLDQFGIGERAIVVPHEPVPLSDWPLSIPKPGKGPLRIVLLGTLANHKGSRIVAPVVETAPRGMLAVHCIGELEDTFPPEAAALVTSTGRYQDDDLPALIQKARPHVIWLPSVAPESYSYTLTAAIDAGLPIAATRFGAFPERLDGRPYTWLIDHDSTTETWLETFRLVRQALEKRPAKQSAVPRRPIADFYATQYLSPPPARPGINRGAKPVISVVAERFGSGHLSPCAFIRLLQPLTHPDIGGGFTVVLDDAESALARRADIIVTQRHALPDRAAADALDIHAKRSGARLVYDLDDDLLAIPPSHPDAAWLRPRAKVVRRLLDVADEVWVSSAGLAERLGQIRPDTRLVPNGLDERIWAYGRVPPRWQPDPIRILCMGSATHERDLALILPALQRLRTDYPDRVTIDVIGMTPSFALPPGLRRLSPPFYATQSYPAFVHWINTVTPGWHVGLAPLADTPFNRAKSAIKTMDYAAMGLAILASDVPAYHGSLADGVAGRLVSNEPDAWLDALSWLVRDQALWRATAGNGRAAFLAQASLKCQAEGRRAAWTALLGEGATAGT
jgi:glycosyltransferase involved in cell wall biosynthesis/GT2 family glycosyltransferase